MYVVQTSVILYPLNVSGIYCQHERIRKILLSIFYYIFFTRALDLGREDND